MTRERAAQMIYYRIQELESEVFRLENKQFIKECPNRKRILDLTKDTKKLNEELLVIFKG